MKSINQEIIWLVVAFLMGVGFGSHWMLTACQGGAAFCTWPK